MKYVIIAVIIALILFMVLTRSVSSLELENGQTLLLKVDRHTIRLDTHSVEQEQLDFRTVTVLQSVLQDEEGTYFVFEHAYTDSQYQFDHRSMAQTMKTIFAAKKVSMIYQRNNLTFYQMRMDDGYVINLILHQSGDQTLNFAYGFSNAKFIQILKEIEPSSTSIEKKLEEDAIVPDSSDKSIKTRWSVLMNTIDSLIIPLDSSS